MFLFLVVSSACTRAGPVPDTSLCPTSQAMAHVLRMNCSLTELYLNSNNITEHGAAELAGALLFNDSSRLKKLFVFGNPLGEAGIHEFTKLRQEV
jgi:hypothetical protein